MEMSTAIIKELGEEEGGKKDNRGGDGREK